MYIEYNVKNLLESVFFPRHFHALYIAKLQLKKIYDIYDTNDNNNRTNRYANYVKYNINDNDNINNKDIINIMFVLFGRYDIFGKYIIYDWSVSFCRFQRQIMSLQPDFLEQ
jgi:hypothetical protein